MSVKECRYKCGDHCQDCGAHEGHHKQGCAHRPDDGCPVDGCAR